MRRSGLAALVALVTLGVALATLPGSSTPVLADPGDCARLQSQSDYLTGVRALSPGQAYSVYIEPANCGTTTWRPGSYGYRGTGLLSGDYGICCDIPPGGGIRVNLWGNAPSSPGKYYTGFILTHNGATFGPHYFIEIEVRGEINCPGQYRAEYFNNRFLSGGPTWSQCENWPIDHDWGLGGPGRGVAPDNFSARWTGRAHIDAGMYTAIATADDGIKVWIGNNLVIDAWRDQPPTEYRQTFTINNSGDYDIKVEYYENGGLAVAKFRWERQSNDSRQSVSANPYRDASQCTWFAEERVHETTGLWMPNLGNARDWAINAPRYGWSVGSRAENASVIVLPYDNGRLYWYWTSTTGWRQTSISEFGHVAWVDAISCGGSCVHVIDRNWKLDGRDGERWIWIGYGEPVRFIYSSR